MRKKLLASDQIIVDAYNNGSTSTEIADFFKVAPGTITSILRSHGVKIRPKGPYRKEKPNASE